MRFTAFFLNNVFFFLFNLWRKAKRSVLYKKEYFFLQSIKELFIHLAEARRLISSGGFYVNNQRITDAFCTIDTNRDFIEERVCLLRTGKKSFTLLLIDL